ncbi:4Fe-4S dicluster domain-containing protein [Hydrogenimonas sp. SS33]|uniref:4Fe-4S binding protein n=1 Tax=Hydrogenimonas leucolamina TaxID=2954236 RepID=UPI00336C07CA
MGKEAAGETIFHFDPLHCLRNDYAKNDCSLCIDLCPEEAMVFDRKRLVLDLSRCTACSACMGVCPTQAFENDTFDPERFVEDFAKREATLLDCEKNVPCIMALSSEHLAALALMKKSPLQCDLSRCGSCPVNKEGKVLSAIESAVEEANRFLETAGMPERIEKVVEAPEAEEKPNRRELFRKLAAVAKGKEGLELPDKAPLMEEKRQPPVRPLLKKALKARADAFGEATTSHTRFSFVVGKRIDADTCNNCQECAMFCPTGAMSILQDNTGIIFQLGKCIACGICNDVCQPRSVSDDETFDLVTFAFDRMDLLVKHRLEMCEECKVAFPYKGGEKICDRCKDFKANYSDLFTMAKDLE